MLANLRCNELKLEAVKEFQSKVQPLSKQIGKLIIPDLGLKFSEIINESLQVYDTDGCGYHENTYKVIREELISALLDQSKDLFHTQMKFILNSCFLKTKELFSSKIPKNQAIEEFSDVLNEIVGVVREEFLRFACSSLVENSGWEISEFQLELDNYLADKISDEKEKQFNLLITEINSTFGGKFTTEIGKILDGAMELNVWQKIKTVQTKTMEPLEIRILNIFRNLDKTEEKAKIFVNSTRVKCVEVIRQKIDRFIKNLEEIMTKKFNVLFNKDEKGIPRDPKTTNYEEVFSSSKSKVLPILDQFKYFMITPDWDQTTTEGQYEELLNDESFEKIIDSFLRDAERTYKDALHIKEFGYNRGGLPKWVLLLIVLLGWNEFLWIMQSPIILYPSVFLASIVALLFSLGLGSVPKLLISQLIKQVPFLF